MTTGWDRRAAQLRWRPPLKSGDILARPYRTDVGWPIETQAKPRDQTRMNCKPANMVALTSGYDQHHDALARNFGHAATIWIKDG